jgi:hypothetical protein
MRSSIVSFATSTKERAVISERLEAYPSRERFADLILGLLSMSGRVAAVASIPRADGREAVRDARAELFADLFLGAISLGRTVGATLTCEAAAAARAEPAPAADRGSAPARTVLLR